MRDRKARNQKVYEYQQINEQEDIAIHYLVKQYGIKKQTTMVEKMKEIYGLFGPSVLSKIFILAEKNPSQLKDDHMNKLCIACKGLQDSILEFSQSKQKSQIIQFNEEKFIEKLWILCNTLKLYIKRTLYYKDELKNKINKQNK